MLKTYALIDVIGIKKAIANGEGKKALSNFWGAAESWVNYSISNFDSVFFENNKGSELPAAFVTTFSDSAILHTKNEYVLSDFWKIALSLHERINFKTGMHSYMIINRDEEIPHPDFPTTGGRISYGLNSDPSYFNVGGSGPVVANLFIAEKVINNHHNEYYTYAISDQSLPDNANVLEEFKFKGMNGDGIIFAIDIPAIAS